MSCERISTDIATLTAEVPPGSNEADIERTQWASRTTGGWSNDYVDGPATIHHATVRPGLAAEGRVRFQTRDGWTGWSGTAGCAAEPERPALILEYGDLRIPLVAVQPGPFESDLESATWAELSRDASDDLPTPCPDSSTWRVTTVRESHDASLEELFTELQSGTGGTDSPRDASLIRLESDNTTELRLVTYKRIIPINYVYWTSVTDGQESRPLHESFAFSPMRCEIATA